MIKDITGQRFGRLVVLRLDEKQIKGQSLWQCQCDCGNIVSVRSDNLKNGHTESCGCILSLGLTKNGAKDLTGQRFGMLVALRPTDMRKNGQIVWECKCDCGNTAFIPRSYLIKNQKNSCGCLRKTGWQNIKEMDLTGQRFGRLVVLRLDEKQTKGPRLWECLCDCGNTTFAKAYSLLSGHKASCGCLREPGLRNVKTKDLTGQRFGNLVALRLSDVRKNNQVLWECKCDCGETAFVKACNLTTNRTTSCGCTPKESATRSNIIDLTGQRFGKLVALRPTEERKNGFVMWECKCDCGNTVLARSSTLKSGRKTSCGCLCKPGMHNAKAKDLTGQRFGRLVALRPTDMRKNGQIVWECQCDCGNITFINSCSLTEGRNLSCGCL